MDYTEPKNAAKLLNLLDGERADPKDEIVFIDKLNAYDNYFEIKMVPIEKAYGVIIKDVTLFYKEHEKVKHKALHDDLTSLPNRTLFLDRLNTEIKKSKRDEKTFAVMFFDLNKFKEINDEHGHSLGDDYLVEFSQRISMSLRESDTLARLGGDEFIAILSNLQKVEEIDAIVDKICASLKEPLKRNGVEVELSTSIGVSVYPQDGDNMDVLILKADNAMYKSKKNGDKYHKYDSDL